MKRAYDDTVAPPRTLGEPATAGHRDVLAQCLKCRFATTVTVDMAGKVVGADAHRPDIIARSRFAHMRYENELQRGEQRRIDEAFNAWQRVRDKPVKYLHAGCGGWMETVDHTAPAGHGHDIENERTTK